MKLSIVYLSNLVGLAFAASRTSPPSGAIVVAKSGGQYTGLQAAIDSIGTSNTGNVVIFIQPGSYSGQVYINSNIQAKITIYGYTTNDQDYNQNQVTLVNSLGSNDASGTLRAHTDYFNVYNINIQNSRGSGVQAIALSAQGDYQGYYGCKLLGYQDTLLVNEGHNVFVKNYIEGATDFIFGQRAIAWFEKCLIAISGNGYITANGRDSASNPSYYVINSSTIQAKSGVSGVLTYLGRPWRAYARTVFQNTAMTSVVRPEGWSTWSVALDNVYYAEYGNTGDGSKGTRVSWAKTLSAPLTLSGIIGSTSWIDMNYWNNVSTGTTTTSRTTTTSSRTTTTSSRTTTTSSRTTTTTSRTTTTPATTGGANCNSSLYGQCGGAGWTGCTGCSEGTCKYQNDWYSQCLN
ncbi:Pectinesterase [Dactylella cylindrospora]|nr:Pectinesterase [Dactylella cylindrospora]